MTQSDALLGARLRRLREHAAAPPTSITALLTRGSLAIRRPDRALYYHEACKNCKYTYMHGVCAGRSHMIYIRSLHGGHSIWKRRTGCSDS